MYVYFKLLDWILWNFFCLSTSSGSYTKHFHDYFMILWFYGSAKYSTFFMQYRLSVSWVTPKKVCGPCLFVMMDTLNSSWNYKKYGTIIHIRRDTDLLLINEHRISFLTLRFWQYFKSWIKILSTINYYYFVNKVKISAIPTRLNFVYNR